MDKIFFNSENSKKQNFLSPSAGNYLHCIYNYLGSIYSLEYNKITLEMI